VVIRSDNISSLNADGVKAMWEYGVNTVIDLRTQTEATQFPSPFAAPDYGPEYRNLPVIDDAFMARVNETDGIPNRYRLMVDHRQQAFGQIFSALAGLEGPAVVHCYAGKDRTGLVAAMALSLVGVEDDAIAADYAETDVHLAQRYAEWLASASPERTRTPLPRTTRRPTSTWPSATPNGSRQPRLSASRRCAMSCAASRNGCWACSSTSTRAGEESNRTSRQEAWTPPPSPA